MPHFAINVALQREGQIVAGVTYNPANADLFWAERGKGAYLNDRRLRVAARTRFEEAVFATGIPFLGHGQHGRFLKELHQIGQRVSGVRRFGSAALDLAWVAAGRFDGFWERDLSPWDMAAGILMVTEAGGVVTDADGGDGRAGRRARCAAPTAICTGRCWSDCARLRSCSCFVPEVLSSSGVHPGSPQRAAEARSATPRVAMSFA